MRRSVAIAAALAILLVVGALVTFTKRSPPALSPPVDIDARPAENAGSPAMTASAKDPDVAAPGSAREPGDGCSLIDLLPDIAGDLMQAIGIAAALVK